MDRILLFPLRHTLADPLDITVWNKVSSAFIFTSPSLTLAKEHANSISQNFCNHADADENHVILKSFLVVSLISLCKPKPSPFAELVIGLGVE